MQYEKRHKHMKFYFIFMKELYRCLSGNINMP